MPSRFELANAIRALSMDAVQKAKSGHPGAPMGMADIAQVLWCDHLKHNPNNPEWVNRDRFVLSNGHGSMLIYSLLHLTGYSVSIDDLKAFRQLHSKTPGHPEFGYTPGVETTTGPLGQGIANAVGMAIAEKTLAAQFNQPGYDIIDHHTYAFLGDGCLMEGISHEVCSLAGTLGLGKLIAFYDDNGISIDGEVEGWFTDDTVKRFRSYGWHVVADVDGHDPEAVEQAIQAAKSETGKPTLICCKTTIGFGSPNKGGKEDCHGAPLGEEEIELVRKELKWPHAPFEVPSEISSQWDAREAGSALEAEWNDTFIAYREAHPALAAELTRRLSNRPSSDFEGAAKAYIAKTQADAANVATRKASQNTINAYAPFIPEFIGGSADLAGSNLTLWEGAKGIDANDASGNYLFYGVREFGMCAIMNGIKLHGGFIPFGGTFLMFMEYARNAIRMAALMKQQAIYVFTHDSIGLGEDGPTHQPVEQLSSMRATPNLTTWRPCDATETAVAWKKAVENQSGPTALVLTRQGVPTQPKTDAQLSLIEKGGYVLADCDGEPELIIIATGSEVELAMQAKAELSGKSVRVVSMPSCEVFEKQDVAYKESVLPSTVVKRLAVEAAHGDFWYKYVGLNGAIVSVNRFGESAPAGELFKEFGLTVDNVVEKARGLLG
ncbi:transketolase [Aliikangiella sp. G2MR2-5]|uniref:transketolase n=1 Tax=Aliikangiella sp. G2MR2-5 TaxID=2788943 RepID=UPI0018AAD23C|nr:transketolase [Aliikangiella sp. G2MR2-5]